MPELPEVEVLARHLRPLLRGKTIRGVSVRRDRVLKPTSPKSFRTILLGAKFNNLSRRGKYLLFQLQTKAPGETVTLLGHLGMTGRIFVALKNERLPKHTAVIFDLGNRNFIYEDTRYFGRMTLDLSPVEKLGPEPLDKKFSPELFWKSLKRSRQPVKVKLLDQSLVAGVGNIYASEALFRARISPKLAANRLTFAQAKQLWRAVRAVLTDAIKFGSTVPLKFASGKSDGLFYYGRASDGEDFYEERLRVYDRAGKPCLNCGSKIKRITQAARSTFFCPCCQKSR
ncbi:MAG TPA: bifunctional DNA-formamidopyrimidine glycosylase/DNA-(apurinic or apyrimidinic site) lyase [Candidatus Aquilonibacter sp.]|nr:bifunctional DNA-formamidopyrimidine glycosylase/DNA-(apurinic or apyrimidinic site) lyase [Candidatus Aquilonibacter sp.]